MIDPKGTEFTCSFCAKSGKEVRLLVAGITGYICNECIGLCADIANQAPVVQDQRNQLHDMWEQQLSFMRLLQEKRGFPEFPVDTSSKPGQQFIDGIAFHLMKEVFEAIQHLKNAKQHRATEITDFDHNAYLEELVDVQHLFYEICIASGIGLDDFYDAYMAKGRTNVERIAGGY